MKKETKLLIIICFLLGIVVYQTNEMLNLVSKIDLLEIKLIELQRNIVLTNGRIEDFNTSSSLNKINGISSDFIRNLLLLALVVAIVIVSGYVSYKLCFIIVNNFERIIENFTSETKIIIFKLLKNLGGG